MNVLSLFDGMSCGRAALESAGIKVDKYFASEIDKYAMAVSAYNYPDIIQIGDVCKVDVKTLPKIDLILGGFPCQGFSLAGKQLNFNDPRSALFFEFVRILKEVREINPDVKFLLENVKMKKEYQDRISDIMGCNPIVINSALVSAQNRVRLYWTNIEVVGLPEDKGILLKDILEDDVPEKYFLSEKTIEGIKQHKQRHEEAGNGFGAFLSDGNSKSGTILSRYYKDGKECLIKAVGNLYDNNLTSVQKDNRIRRLTPGECESLQTMPKGYTAKGMMNGKEVIISDSQRYKMLGNGWTRYVIEFLLKFMNAEVVKEAKAMEKQTTLLDILEVR